MVLNCGVVFCFDKKQDDEFSQVVVLFFFFFFFMYLKARSGIPFAVFQKVLCAFVVFVSLLYCQMFSEFKFTQRVKNRGLPLLFYCVLKCEEGNGLSFQFIFSVF